MEKIKVKIYEILLCLSNAQDLISPLLSGHHEQVAYLSYKIAEQLNMPIENDKNIFLSAIVHDIGALSNAERLELIENEPINAKNHAFIGADIISGFKPMEEAAEIIRYHHLNWDNGKGLFYNGKKVPIESHILHIADRVCVKINKSKNVLSQIPDILKYLEDNKNTVFNPEYVEAIKKISKKEYIWLDLTLKSPVEKLPEYLFDTLPLNIDEVIEIALIFSKIIDSRSKFTANHSFGVAVTAYQLASLMGFSPLECKLMLVAGYLHDIGKLAISNDILEKHAKLNEEEFNEIRSHTYYTYHLLDRISAFETIKNWASFHHEKLNGNGYPFHIKGEYLSLGSRIMAVTDVFTAITENRPYRKGMIKNDVVNILNKLVLDNSIDGNVVKILIDNYDMINKKRIMSQTQIY